MAQKQGIADNPILITPKTVAYMIAATTTASILSYMWIFSTFVTVATFDVHAKNFNSYAVGQDVKALKLSVRATNSELWVLEGKLTEPSGNNLRNRERIQFLRQQKENDKTAIECLQLGHQHCLSDMDSG